MRQNAHHYTTTYKYNMHEELIDFFLYVRSRIPDFFVDGVDVLDVGSGDVNGTNRPFFDQTCKYQGNDAFPGRNVDLVYKTTELPFQGPSFDVIISSECFQHDPEWKDSLRKIVQMLRPGGLLLFSCATTGRPEHGTKKHEPIRSFATRGKLSKFMNHYYPLTYADLASAINLDKTFLNFGCFENTKSHDLFFWGIKAGGRRKFPIQDYTARHVELIAKKSIEGVVTVSEASTAGLPVQQPQQQQQEVPRGFNRALPNAHESYEPAKLRNVGTATVQNEIVQTTQAKPLPPPSIQPPPQADLNQRLSLDDLPANERDAVLEYLRQMGKV
jgi:SAM-dependent methyltransferase